jgi:integrase
MGELRALRWRDVDFPKAAIRVARNLSNGVLGSPKGRRIRAVPMIPEVAKTLARLRQRGVFTGDDDLVFPGMRSAERVLDAVDYEPEQDEVLVGDFLDRSALRRRFKAAVKRAGLRELRFHDLRHTFASLGADEANPVELQAYMGHSDLRTTMRYLHHKSRADEAERLARAFQPRTELERALENVVEAAD